MPNPPDALGGGTFKPPPPVKRGPSTGEAFKANKSFYNKGFEPPKVTVPKLSALSEAALALDTKKEAFFPGVGSLAGRAMSGAGMALRGFGGRAAGAIGAGATRAMGAARTGMNAAITSPVGRMAGKAVGAAGVAGTAATIGGNMATNGQNGRSVYASDATLAKLASDLSQIPGQDTNEALVTRLKLAQAGAAPINPRDLGAILFHAIRG